MQTGIEITEAQKHERKILTACASKAHRCHELTAGVYVSRCKIVDYDTCAMKLFLTSVSLQHESKANDVITLVNKTFFRTSIVRNFISRGVKMRISAREANRIYALGVI